MVFKYTAAQAAAYARGEGGPRTSQLHTEREAERADIRAAELSEIYDDPGKSESEQRIADWRRDNPDRWVINPADKTQYIGVGEYAGRGLEFDESGHATQLRVITEEQAALLPEPAPQMDLMDLQHLDFQGDQPPMMGMQQTIHPGLRPTVDEFGMPTPTVRHIDMSYGAVLQSDVDKLSERAYSIKDYIVDKGEDIKESDYYKKLGEWDEKLAKVNPIPTQKELALYLDPKVAPLMPDISKKTFVSGLDIVGGMPVLPVYVGKEIAGKVKGEKITTDFAKYTGEWLSEGYDVAKLTPVSAAGEIAKDVALMYAGGWAIGAASKVGVVAGRGLVGRGGSALAKKWKRYESITPSMKSKIPIGPEAHILREKYVISLPSSVAKLRMKAGKLDLTRRYTPTQRTPTGAIYDHTKFQAGKLREDLFKLPEKLVEPGMGLYFGAHVLKDIQSTEKADLPAKLAGYGIGFAGAARGYRAPERAVDVLRVRGRTEVPVEELVTPDILSGKETFATIQRGENIRQIKRRFEDVNRALDEAIEANAMVIHATTIPQASKFTVGYGATRPSDMPGLYGAPSKEISPYFLRTGEIRAGKGDSGSILSTIFSPAETFTPTLIGGRVPGIGRIPSRRLESIATSRDFIAGVKSGKAILTRDVELAVKGGRKVEIEATIPPRTEMIQYDKSKYVMIGSRKVPINLYETHSAKNIELLREAGRIEIIRTKLKKKSSLTKSEKEELVRLDIKIKEYGPIKREFIEKSFENKALREAVESIQKSAGISGKSSGDYYIPTRSKIRYIMPGKSYMKPPGKSYVPPVSSSVAPPVKSYVPLVDSYVPRPGKSYVPPDDSYVPRPGESYIPSPDESYVPPPRRSYVPDYIPHDKYIVGGIDGPKMKDKKVSTHIVRRGDYDWKLVNPIAALEEMMAGRKRKK